MVVCPAPRVDFPQEPFYYLTVMSEAIRKTERAYTYRDYRGWPEEERWELIDGVAYDMSPAPSRKHQELSREIGRLIADFLVGKPCRVYFAPFDVRLPRFPEEKDDDVETVVQPDIVVVCDQGKLDDHGCRGAPDWIIEILSPATAAKDLKIKLALYERHGVRELWFVHPTDRTVMVFVLGAGDAYEKPRFLGPEDNVSSTVLPDLMIDFKAVFAEAER
jgi:Uma2 family endonuclease